MLKYPDFFQIPRIVALNKSLQDMDKMVYAAVYWLERLKDGKCTAKNETLAEIIGTESGISIANSLTRLEEQGFIKRVYSDDAHRNRLEIKCRVVYGKLSSPSETVSSSNDRVSSVSDRQVSSVDEQNKKIIIRKGKGVSNETTDSKDAGKFSSKFKEIRVKLKLNG